jgi:uncharacterized protein
LVPILDFLVRFSSILWEAMPFIVLGALIAGILEEYMPQEFITRLLPRGVLPSVMIGAVLGLVFPMCECGIVVVMRRLLRKGMPLSCSVSYMLAGPIINPVVIMSTWVAFDAHKLAEEMVGLRVGLGFLIAVVTALVVHGQYLKYGNTLLTTFATPPAVPDPETDPVPAAPPVASAVPTAVLPVSTVAKQPFVVRLGNISATALHDFVDITVFLILGAVFAALARSYITNQEIESFSRDQPFIAIPAMMVLAILICLCSEADAFIAASFTNMHLSAKIAFLVLGPMLDLKLLMMFTRVFRVRLIVTIVTCVVVLTLILSMAVHLVYKANDWSGLPHAG